MGMTALTIPAFNVPAVSSCNVCGRVLTNPDSIEAGIGPICAHKHGRDDEFEERIELDPFDPATMDITCRRLNDRGETPVFNIRQRHKHHSPSGMEFGYAGSGPADFAINVLALFLPVHPDAVSEGSYDEFIAYERGAPPRHSKTTCWDSTDVSSDAWVLHQPFKEAFIARLPREGGVIRGDVIRSWIRAQEVS